MDAWLRALDVTGWIIARVFIHRAHLHCVPLLKRRHELPSIARCTLQSKLKNTPGYGYLYIVLAIAMATREDQRSPLPRPIDTTT